MRGMSTTLLFLSQHLSTTTPFTLHTFIDTNFSDISSVKSINKNKQEEEELRKLECDDDENISIRSSILSSLTVLVGITVMKISLHLLFPK